MLQIAVAAACLRAFLGAFSPARDLFKLQESRLETVPALGALFSIGLKKKTHSISFDESKL